MKPVLATFTVVGPIIWCDNPQVRMWKILHINNNDFHHLGRSQMCAGAGYVFSPSKPHSGTLWDVFELMSVWLYEYIRTKKVMTIKVTTTEVSTPRYWWCMDMDVECGCKVAAWTQHLSHKHNYNLARVANMEHPQHFLLDTSHSEEGIISQAKSI